MNQKIAPDKDEVSDIVNNFNVHTDMRFINGVLSIQFNDNKNIEKIVMELTKQDYSFEIFQDFELPPKIIVYSKINPEL